MPGSTTCGICGRRIDGHPPLPTDQPVDYYGNGFAKHVGCTPGAPPPQPPQPPAAEPLLI